MTAMPLLEFEPTTPTVEWAKAVDALDSAATVMSSMKDTNCLVSTVCFHKRYTLLCSRNVYSLHVFHCSGHILLIRSLDALTTAILPFIALFMLFRFINLKKNRFWLNF
jgi:hypothetical protein